MSLFPSVELFHFNVSRFMLDGGAMFGVVPRPVWEHYHKPDDSGAIPMVSRVVVARFRELQRVILIDSGMGNNWSDKEISRYRIEPGDFSLSTALASIGIDPEQVTDAIMTHLHFDHAGGWVAIGKSGELSPFFPRARHYVQRSQWDWAQSASRRDQASFISKNFTMLDNAGLVVFKNGPFELFNGLDVIISNGHTPGMQIPIIRGEQGTFVFPSDLIPTAAHAHLAWGMAYDLLPLETIQEKTRLLTQAVEQQWCLVLEHDPSIEMARAVAKNDDFKLVSVDCPGEN
jgi:glyoxylase-like metal-dependent hydrolase (beta-lactamase superfamily II)